jgi:hypothetical protein
MFVSFWKWRQGTATEHLGSVTIDLPQEDVNGTRRAAVRYRMEPPCEAGNSEIPPSSPPWGFLFPPHEYPRTILTRDNNMSSTKRSPKTTSNSAVASHPIEQEGHKESPVAEHVRSAGPEAMRDEPVREWDEVDQAADESFSSSDPPSHSPAQRIKTENKD